MRALTLALAATSAAAAAIDPKCNFTDDLTVVDADRVDDGLTFVAPIHHQKAWLVDIDGAVVKRWDLDWDAGVKTQLTPDGRLLRVTCPYADDDCGGGGYGGGIQFIEWDGTVSWDWKTDGIHHDVLVLPSGNILTCIHYNKTAGEARALGRSDVPDDVPDDENYMLVDSVVEVAPRGATGGDVVWEWRVEDHLVQDVDAGLAASFYGAIGEHPERLDINVKGTGGVGEVGLEFNHLNSLDYNAHLDQVMMSFRSQSEIYIVDHSTTTEEARGSTGGRGGRGGDFLYRWGNPANYARGGEGDQRLFLQHNAHWVMNDLPLMPGGAAAAAAAASDEEQGQKKGPNHVLVFNNEAPEGTAVTELVLPKPDPATGLYEIDLGNATAAPFAPEAPVWEYEPGKDAFFAGHISGSQRLAATGNTLVCNGETAEVFELAADDDAVVWNFAFDGCRGDTDDGGTDESWDCLFRAYRFGYDYPAFDGRDVSTPVECQ